MQNMQNGSDLVMRKRGEVGRLIEKALVDRADGSWDQRDLARAIGKTEAWVSRIMSGNIQLSVKMLMEIAKVLNINPASLLPGSEDNSKKFRDLVEEIVEEKLIGREKAKQ